MRNSKRMPEVNAGSMADIAFLLLIFFLVTATISSDEGISRLLPRECPPEIADCTIPIHERNVLRIVINNDDKIMIENDIISIDKLKDITKDFLDNNGANNCSYCKGNKISTASENPQNAVISLQNGKHTSYKQYVTVQNELTKAYKELRNTYSAHKFGKPLGKLSKTQLKEVKNAYPLILSEAEISTY